MAAQDPNPNAVDKKSSQGSSARYNTGIPSPLPQSLAKMRLCAFSHAGDELLQSPPRMSRVFPLTASSSEICLGPASIDSSAIHFPSGDMTEFSGITAEGAGTACRVPGSNIMVVDVPFLTRSK